MIILQQELLKQHPDTCGLAICWGFPSQSEFKSRLLPFLETNSLHLKLDGWMVGRRSFPFGMGELLVSERVICRSAVQIFGPVNHPRSKSSLSAVAVATKDAPFSGQMESKLLSPHRHMKFIQERLGKIGIQLMCIYIYTYI